MGKKESTGSIDTPRALPPVRNPEELKKTPYELYRGITNRLLAEALAADGAQIHAAVEEEEEEE